MPDSAHILKVELRNFADGLGLGYVREREVNEDTKIFGLKYGRMEVLSFTEIRRTWRGTVWIRLSYF